MSTNLSINERYTFGRITGKSVILDSTDNVQAIKSFKAGLEATGSGTSHPITVKGHASGYGIQFMAHNENQAVMTLAASNDDGDLKIFADGTEKIHLSGNISTTTAHLRSGTNTNSHDILLCENSDGLDALKVRSDGKVRTFGGDFHVYAADDSNDYIRLHVTGDNGYFDYGFGGDMHFRQSSTIRIELDGSVLFTENVRPDTNDSFDLGSSALKWDDVHATNGSIQTSDRNLKEHISGSNLGLSFINNLNPVSYKHKGKNRNHYGLIAQEVSESLASSSIHTDNFAGYIKDDIYSITKTKPDPSDLESGNTIQVVKKYSKKQINKEGWDINDYTFVSSSLGLRYTEFISPLIKAVQELSAEVETLKARITALEG